MEVAPENLDVVAVVDLEHDAAGLGTDQLIVYVYHRLAVQPSLDVVTFDTQTKSVPFAFLKNILFLVRNLNQPATAV